MVYQIGMSLLGLKQERTLDIYVPVRCQNLVIGIKFPTVKLIKLQNHAPLENQLRSIQHIHNLQNHGLYH